MAATSTSTDVLARALDDRETAEALTLWEGTSGRRVTLPEDDFFKARGFTEAYVFPVFVHAHERLNEDDQNVVAKVLMKDDLREVSRHRQAYREADGYASEHLVDLKYEAIQVGSERILYFQGVAGGTNRHKPAGQLNAETQGRSLVDLVVTVARGVAADWNPRVRLTPEAVTIGEFANAELNHLASGAATVDAVAAASGLASRSARSVVLDDGRVCPNPYLLGTGQLPQSERRLKLLYGRSHGDLHLDNILLLFDDLGWHPETYRLIDLSTYSDTAPRSRDQVMLLLSLMARFLPEVHGRKRRELCDKLCMPTRPGYDRQDPLIDEVIAEVFSATHQVVTAGNAGFGLHWEEQYLLQLMATALRFTTFSRLEPATRWWFLGLACIAARHYFRSHELEIDTSASVTLSNPFPEDDPDAPLVPRSLPRPDGFILGTLPENPERRPGDELP